MILKGQIMIYLTWIVQISEWVRIRVQTAYQVHSTDHHGEMVSRSQK